MNPLPPVTSICVMLPMDLSSRCSTLRMLLDDDGEIAPKAQRDKQLRHDKHWSEQQVGRVVYQRRLPPLEHAVPNNLRRDADDNQMAVSNAHTGSRRMTNDHGSG